MNDYGSPPNADSQSLNETYRQFDWSDISPAVSVIETVAISNECDPINVDELHNWIDPEALNKMFEPHEKRADSELSVVFNFIKYEVTLRWGGHVTVRETK